MRLPAARLTPLGDATLVIRSLRGRMLHLAEFIHKFAMSRDELALRLLALNIFPPFRLSPLLRRVVLRYYLETHP